MFLYRKRLIFSSCSFVRRKQFLIRSYGCHDSPTRRGWHQETSLKFSSTPTGLIERVDKLGKFYHLSRMYRALPHLIYITWNHKICLLLKIFSVSTKVIWWEGHVARQMAIANQKGRDKLWDISGTKWIHVDQDWMQWWAFWPTERMLAS